TGWPASRMDVLLESEQVQPAQELRQRVQLVDMVRAGVARIPDHAQPALPRLAQLLHPRRAPLLSGRCAFGISPTTGWPWARAAAGGKASRRPARAGEQIRRSRAADRMG